MDLQNMTKEELIHHILEMNEYMDNVIVFWGDKKELRETLQHVAQNPDQEFTPEEARDAAAMVRHEAAFEELVEMLRDSFERGGINFAISEKMSAIMQTLADKYGKT
jgi:hypothetical protein